MVAPRAFPSWVCLRVTPFNSQLMHFFRIFLYPLDISPELLKKSTSYFGYNPRCCFNSATSVKKLEKTKEAIQSRITNITFEQSNMVQVLYSSRTGYTGVSHSIFELSPNDEL